MQDLNLPPIGASSPPWSGGTWWHDGACNPILWWNLRAGLNPCQLGPKVASTGDCCKMLPFRKMNLRNVAPGHNSKEPNHFAVRIVVQSYPLVFPSELSKKLWADSGKMKFARLKLPRADSVARSPESGVRITCRGENKFGSWTS